MLTAAKQEQLNGFLGRLPEHIAARLAKAVEVDRLIGGEDLPHEELLDALRPQLRQMDQCRRMPTPQRYFCRPFEDLLINGMPKVKQPGRIARASIVPVWHWLANKLMPDHHKELIDRIRTNIVAERENELFAAVAELWQAAADAIGEALASEEARGNAARLLGSRVIAQDAAEMALLMKAGTDIVVLQSRLPRPIVSLDEDEIAVLRDTYDRFLATYPDAAAYVALIAMGRMERPWGALHLAARLARQSTDTLISNTDIGIVGELLYSDLDRYVDRMRAARPADLDVDALVEALGAFAELSSGMVKEVGIRREGKWGQRLTQARATVAQIMEAFVERSKKEIAGALPTARVGGYGKGPKPLDLTRAPDPEKVERAMRYARFLAYAKPFAVAAAFHAKLAEVLDMEAERLRTLADDLLREIRAPREGSYAAEHFAVLLDLCALVLGEEETGLLRRRAKVAA